MHGELENGLRLSLLFSFYRSLFARSKRSHERLLSGYASRATSGRTAELLANLHLNGTTYLPVPCGPRHNSSPLPATVHAKEKNDASENSPAVRRDGHVATFTRNTTFPSRELPPRSSLNFNFGGHRVLRGGSEIGR